VPRYDLSRAVWRTSSYSGQNGDCVEVAYNIPSLVAVRDSKDRGDLTRAAWRISSCSGQNGACVEVAGGLHGVVVVRDSKDRDGPVLAIDPEEWRGFTDQVTAGQFDPR